MRKSLESGLAILRTLVDGLQAQIGIGAAVRTALRNAGVAFNVGIIALSTVPAVIATSPALTIQGSGKFIVSGSVGAATGGGFTFGTINIQAQIGAGSFGPEAQTSLSGVASETASGATTTIIDLSANPIGTTVHFALSAVLGAGTANVTNTGGTQNTAQGMLTWQEIPA